jgi:hypothetical protein
VNKVLKVSLVFREILARLDHKGSKVLRVLLVYRVILARLVRKVKLDRKE